MTSEGQRYGRAAIAGVAFLCFFAALLLGDQIERRLLLNTAWLVLAVEAIALPIATLLALLIARTQIAFRTVALVLLVSLLFVPLYLHTSGWDAAFGRLGWYTTAVTGLREPWLASWRGAIFVHAMYAIPWASCLLAVLFRHGDRELEEAALLEAGPLQVFRTVTLPQLAGPIAIAAAWIFVITAGEMTVTNIYLVPTYAEEVYNYYAAGADLQATTLHHLPLVLFTLGLALASLLAVERFRRLLLSRRRAYVWSLGRSRWWASLLLLGVVVAMVLLPVANLVERMGEEVRVVSQRPERIWSAEKALRTVTNVPPKFATEFSTTLQLAAATAVVVTPLAAAMAWWSRTRPAISYVGWMLSALAIAVPAPVLGETVVLLLNHDHPTMIWLYDRTMLAPLLALGVRTFPLSFAACWWAFATLERQALEAAQLDGAGPWRLLGSVALPQRWGVIGAAAVAVMAIASGDLSATILTLPPGMETLPRRMFGLIHAGVDDQVAGVAFASWLAYLIAAVVALGLTRFVKR
jgi:iron(III) transport system permease protein